MYSVFSNRFVQFVIAGVTVFVLLSSILPTGRLVELLNSVFIFISVSFSFVLAPAIWRAVSKPEFDRTSQAAIGVFCLMLSIVLSRAGNVIGRAIGDFDKVANSPLIGLAVYFAIIGSVLLVTAPGMVDGRWRYNRSLVFGAFGAGVVMALVVYALQIQVFR